MTPAEP